MEYELKFPSCSGGGRGGYFNPYSNGIRMELSFEENLAIVNGVLILILMEYGWNSMTPGMLVSMDNVLILILMEYGWNTSGRVLRYLRSTVLILILMEYGWNF